MRVVLGVAGALFLVLAVLVLAVSAMSMSGPDLFLVSLLIAGALCLAGISLLRAAGGGGQGTSGGVSRGSVARCSTPSEQAQ